MQIYEEKTKKNENKNGFITKGFHKNTFLKIEMKNHKEPRRIVLKNQYFRMLKHYHPNT